MTGPRRPDYCDLAASPAIASSTASTAATHTTHSTMPVLKSDDTIDDRPSSDTPCTLLPKGDGPRHCGNMQHAQVQSDYPRPHAFHPHQLAHQHTYPKISLTSLTTPTCIKEEDELSENDNNVANDKRRLSVELVNNHHKGHVPRYGTSSEDDDNATIKSFSNCASVGGGGANIPRTFSTSALRMKNRCLFWDRLGNAPRCALKLIKY